MLKLPTYDIILDFDDVIYPFCQGVRQVMRTEGREGNITQWEMEKDYGIDRDAFWSLLNEPKHHEAVYLQPITAGTLTHLRRLRYAGHRLHIVTARTEETSVHFAREVIRRDNVPLDTLTFTKDKGPMVEELDAAFSLDDAPHNYQALDRRNHLTFLMDAPHNQNFYVSRRVFNMEHFVRVVQGFQQSGVQVRDGEYVAQAG